MVVYADGLDAGPVTRFAVRNMPSDEENVMRNEGVKAEIRDIGDGVFPQND